MKKLIGMVDTLPEHPHSIFLKQKTEIWMFVACKLVDGVWVVLEEPHNYGILNTYLTGNVIMDLSLKNAFEYQQAQERVIFEGFEVKDGYLINNECDCQLNIEWINTLTIEDLVKYNLTLKK